MDAERDGRLGKTWLIEHGPERRQPLPTDVGSPAQERGEEGAGLAWPVGKVVQIAKEPIGGQTIGASHGRRICQPFGRFERGPRVGLGRGSAGVQVERT